MRPNTSKRMRGLATGLAFFLGPGAQAEITLALPIDCTLGETCHIQQYTDHDPGPGATDFSCGSLSYDGHKGTDFALPSLAAQAAGVAVLAASPGVVTALREDMPDILAGQPDAPEFSGRECGNGLILRHDDGWETQYCHMAQGSLTVEVGDMVYTGQSLGMVGLSGNTEFPHLHLSVRQNGTVVDPFAPDAETCGPASGGLWATPPDYVPGGFISLGLTGSPPDYDAVKSGSPLAPLALDAPLIGWVFFFGSQTGDSLTLQITGPNGEVHASAHDLRQQAQAFQFSGRRAPPSGWSQGPYTFTATLARDGIVIDIMSTEAILVE